MARGARRRRRARRLAVAGHRQPRQDRPGPDPARAERGRRGDGRRRRRLLDYAAQGEPGRRRGAGDAGAAERRHARHAAPGAGRGAGARRGRDGARVVRAAADVRGRRRGDAAGARRRPRRWRRSPTRIAATFAADRGLMLAEAAVFALAERMPRPEAQTLVARRSARSAPAPSPRRSTGERPTSTGRRCSIRAGSPATLRRSPTGWHRRGGRAGVDPGAADLARPSRPLPRVAGVQAGEAAAEGRSALSALPTR